MPSSAPAARVDGTTALQAKGFPYPLIDLLGDRGAGRSAAATGVTSTLRLKSSMYHRFHAPADLRVEHVTYLSGDTWNVNPAALKRVERLYCKQRTRGDPGPPGGKRPPC
jgi:phosphatidylserine decarboxylase